MPTERHIFSRERLSDLLGRFSNKRIAVVGDLMVDRYYWGSVHRVSPEAPVPVVEVDTESVRLGGAANVASNIQSLGGVPILIGLIGDDHAGQQFLALAGQRGFDTQGILADPSRPTTMKTRVIAHDQHVVRIDHESKAEASADLCAKAVAVVEKNIGSLQGIIIEDYNKGAVTKGMIHSIVAAARKHNIPVMVDPKFNNFFEYTNVTVFKPNRREAEEVLGTRLRTVDDVERGGRELLERLKAKNVLLTRGEEGMSLFEGNGQVSHIPTAAVNVRDVSGAGDTVIATLTMAVAAGAGMYDACILANSAGGVVVGSVGIVPIQRDQLVEAASRLSNHSEDSV